MVLHGRRNWLMSELREYEPSNVVRYPVQRVRPTMPPCFGTTQSLYMQAKAENRFLASRGISERITSARQTTSNAGATLLIC